MSRGVEQLPRVEVERASGTESGFPDADAFCERVARSDLFASVVPIAVTRAPGRLDILGGIADYSGSLVLTLPLAAAALAAAQLYPDDRVVAVSGDRRVALDVDELLYAPFETLARRFAGRDAWAAYVVGRSRCSCARNRLRFLGCGCSFRPTSLKARAWARRRLSRSPRCTRSHPALAARSSPAGSLSSGSAPSSCLPALRAARWIK